MDIVSRLREKGYKVTPQRLAVWSAIDGVHTHPTAEMIYQSLYPENPTMSLATVYKTLEIFANIGLVKILDVGDDASHYDWDTHEHSHIRCKRRDPTRIYRRFPSKKTNPQENIVK